MRINLEGVDGTGKSSIAKLLAERLRCRYYPTPPESFLSRRESVDAEADTEAHYQFYMEAIRVASAELEFLPNVVIDRYWLTTDVYHRAMGYIPDPMDFLGLVRPDVIVYLTVDPDIQMRRLVARGLTTGDTRMQNLWERLCACYEAALIAPGLPSVIRLDTSLYTVEEATSAIQAALPRPFHV